MLIIVSLFNYFILFYFIMLACPAFIIITHLRYQLEEVDKKPSFSEKK